MFGQEVIMRFSNQIVVITGGTTGIGLSTAQHFQKEGATVVVTGRSADTLASAQKILGEKALVLKSDTSNLADLDALVAKVKTSFGKVDVLFVNAGIAKFAPMEAVTAEFFDETFNTNVRGAFFAVQKFAPVMPSGASVVLNTSIVAEIGFPNATTYSASKAALRSLARTLAADLQPKGVRVNAVSPGPIQTPIYGKLGMDAAGQQAWEDQMTQSNPMKRFGTADEVARAVLFLASSEASYTTGAELPVDGGFGQL
jgi:NAD(P)-dependent dehydrogenase (short-subunit alcohol dehydrogenase family)